MKNIIIYAKCQFYFLKENYNAKKKILVEFTERISSDTTEAEFIPIPKSL